MALAQHNSSLFLMVTRDFFDAANGSGAEFVSFSVSAFGTWSTYEGGFQGESVVGVALLIGVEFGHECL